VDHKQSENILEVQDLKMYFPILRGLMRKKVADIKAIDGVSFKIKRGETLGLVGESGCGKTTVGRCVIRLYRPTSGKIIFEGLEISGLEESKLKQLRQRATLIFQDPSSSLDPRQSAENIVGEPLLIHNMTKTRSDYKEKVEDLFRTVGLDPRLGQRFPHEFSGGQRQRIGIARALASDPGLVVCDEPISALDVSIQAQIINLLEELQDKKGNLTYIFIAHDLSVVKHISDRIAVMYLGRIVELTVPQELYDRPLHPYTKALLSAIPVPDPYVEEKRERIILKGEMPSPINPPSGCPFHVRCNYAKPECSQQTPLLKDVGGGHEVACFLYGW
jgi:peptide/nickel transport system ATP-binding protein